MARPKNLIDVGSVPLDDLVYAANRLIAAGKTTAGELSALAGDRVERICAIKRELAALDGADGGVPPIATRSPPRSEQSVRPIAASAELTPKQIAQRALAARYVRAINRVPANRKVAIRKIAHDEGQRAAIKAMRAMRKVAA